MLRGIIQVYAEPRRKEESTVWTINDELEWIDPGPMGGAQFPSW